MHVYLSPHFDDAVYSCGGQIYQRTQAGEKVVIVTVCAGDPPEGPLSPFAESLHARWRLTVQAAAARRLEDLRACEMLGAQAIHLSVPDCIYRRIADQHPYSSESTIFGALHPAEFALVTQLANDLQKRFEGAQFYAPLGIGNHVDHQLTYRISQALESVRLYEDYPYAENPTLYAATIFDGLAATWEFLSAEALVAKAQAMAAYASQLSSFWQDESDLLTKTRQFAEHTGNGRLAERLWLKSL